MNESAVGNNDDHLRARLTQAFNDLAIAMVPEVVIDSTRPCLRTRVGESAPENLDKRDERACQGLRKS